MASVDAPRVFRQTEIYQTQWILLEKSNMVGQMFEAGRMLSSGPKYESLHSQWRQWHQNMKQTLAGAVWRGEGPDGDPLLKIYRNNVEKELQTLIKKSISEIARWSPLTAEQQRLEWEQHNAAKLCKTMEFPQEDAIEPYVPIMVTEKKEQTKASKEKGKFLARKENLVNTPEDQVCGAEAAAVEKSKVTEKKDMKASKEKEGFLARKENLATTPEAQVHGAEATAVVENSDTTGDPRQLLSGVKSLISQMETLQSESRRCELFKRMREHIHRLEYTTVTRGMLVRGGVFSKENEFSKICDSSSSNSVTKVPWDIAADARRLYFRWEHKIYDGNPFRGIKQGATIGFDRIDENCPRFSPHYHGQGDLVNGQWWPSMLAVLRDGAHGQLQAGISGKSGKGAYSVILGGKGEHRDEDKGDVVLYCGTVPKNQEITTPTKYLMDSADRVKKPVRLIRSSNLTTENRYRPECGFRYDGLYTVTSYHLLDPAIGLYRFRMERCPGQDPIRCKSAGEDVKRPHKYDKWSYKQFRTGGNA